MEEPNWLNASLIQKVLRTAEKYESIKVSGISVKPATAKGDNYSSDMYRVTVEYSMVQDDHENEQQMSLIVKVMPQDAREEMLEAVGVFETEYLMVSQTLPLMNKILEKLGATTLSARCLGYCNERPTYLIVEDLAPKGFRMADRQAGLDLAHSLLAIQNLGRFHAASVALKEMDSSAFKNYTKWMLHEDQPPKTKEFFCSSMRVLADETANWPDINPRLTEKLVKLAKVLYEKGCEAVRYRENDFNVLNHGDCWVNNMLFSYDEQRNPIDHIFLDFQIPCHGSPAIDILYFFGTSPSENVRLHHRELLLREYHNSLNSTMVKLGCKTEVLSFDLLRAALKERALCEVIASMTVLPIVVLEKGEEINIGELLEKDAEFNHAGYRGKTYKRIMTRLLPWYESMGILDL